MANRSIVDVGRFLQKYGLKVGENPAFGGVSGGHAKGSYHYAPGGEAIDITDWRPDMAPAYEGGAPKSWKQRTGELAWRAKKLGTFAETFGPGDPGHDTHVHLALPGKAPLSDQQLEWLATGRYKTPEGKLTDVMPGQAPTIPTQQRTQQSQPVQNQSTGNTFVLIPGTPGGTQTAEKSGDFLTNYITKALSSDISVPKTSFNSSQANPYISLMQNILTSQPDYLS
jgi:hypothetical protein